jgi:hypothetical protein
MRAHEIITEDAKVKSMVIRSLNKIPDDSPIFNDVYKQIVGKPLGNRLDAYINTRGDQDAINAVRWLITAIPTLGSAQEIKAFIGKFADPKFDPINVKALAPKAGMSGPADIGSLITDPFAKKLFDKIFQEFAGKGDAGPGEAALAILSPRITYSSPGDISINDVKVEVKASRGSGKAGRIWDMPLNQKPMAIILQSMGIANFSVLDGEQPFPDPKIGKKFIREACICWFGGSVPAIEKAFGKPGFKNIWQAQVFDTYKAHGKWTGMLALGVKTYQYIVNGQEFATTMKKANQGTICRPGAKQSRELAPQVFIA